MQEQKIGVTYIGRRGSYTDNLYGTKLHFEREQTHFMPRELAERFLRHPEFAQVKEGSDAGKQAETEVEKTETDEALEAAQKEREQQEQEANRLADVRQSISLMDKDKVLEFVRVNFNQTLAKNAKLENLQAKAVQLVDQYGVS